MPTLVRLREATLTGPTDPAEYAATLQALLAQIGTTVGSAEADAVRILDRARQEVTEILKTLAVDAPSRGLYERARAGIDQAIANLAADMGKSVAGYQAAGFLHGVDLAIKPLGGEKGLEVVASAVTQTQLAVLGGFSADLIQNLAAETRTRVNAELASVVVGAKSPYSAALAIGKNLKDANHFSTIAHRARAIVVTEVGRAHALGTQAAMNQLQATFAQAGTGDQVRKRWLNAHLPGARQTHLETEARYAPDGAKGPIPHDQLYEVGGFKALYPRDPSLPASESVHCHCVSVTIIDEGSAQAVAAGAPTAKAQTAYTAAKAEAAAPAEIATAKGPTLTKAGAEFLGDPYGKAGLQPLKPLANGTNGYGGVPLANHLGYTKADNPLVWDKDLKAWKHPKAPAGKQLPAFADLAPLEQKALMDAAGLSPAAQGKVYQHLGTTKPTGAPAYAVSKPKPAVNPVTPVPAAPPPPPPPPPAPAPAPAPRARPRAAAPAPAPAGTWMQRAIAKMREVQAGQHSIEPLTPTTGKRPSLQKAQFTKRLKEMIEEARDRARDVFGYANPPAQASNMTTGVLMKDRSMRILGGRLDEAIDKGRLEDFNNTFPLRYNPGRPSTAGETVASRLTANWAATSGDSHPGALALQRAVAANFDLDWPPVGYQAIDHLRVAERLYDEWKDVLDSYVMALYENTQAELARMYPKGRVRLVRGMSIGQGYTDTVMPVKLNPASSFAINSATAKRFGRTLFWADVPIERILGTSLTGLGCLHEFEYVVIGARQAEDMLRTYG